MKTILAFFEACLNSIRPASECASTPSELCIPAVSFDHHYPAHSACSPFLSVLSRLYLVLIPFPPVLSASPSISPVGSPSMYTLYPYTLSSYITYPII
ncbi:hypothetical protein FIBSPDRAFT_498014 [Athelia psychrophila]|uniref:Uncharacterized protein n=1 Tax=Athelia psychrophila TaxID=1759441 RepID=A0A166KFA1_9AGAM|nr:hypothetical protein FIBSPDRAFT_498014 [Fibularhizoctonia sp. CBS 109695]